MTSIATHLEPGIRRVRAPNPSPMTFTGTNSYVLGEGAVAVIDPGPDDPTHLRALLAALAPGETVSHIFVTHSHLDHSGLAGALSRATGAPVLAFGTHEDGRSEMMRALAAAGLPEGGEGIDRAFRPDLRLRDGEVVDGGTWRIEALWTPGHTANHLCLAWRDILFTGDHVMGWSSSLISPPDGDLTAFMASCERLSRRSDRVYYPGHGEAIPDPAARLDWLIGHRLARERQILRELAAAPADVRSLTRRIYTDLAAHLFPAAERNVLAHLIDLAGRDIVTGDREFSRECVFGLSGIPENLPPILRAGQPT